MSSEDEVRAPPSPSSSAQPKPQGEPPAAAMRSNCNSALAKSATTPSFFSATPPTLAPHQPLHIEGGRPPDEAQGQTGAAPHRTEWSPASASTASTSNASLIVSTHHDDMKLDPPSPGLGIVAAFMAGASASASRPPARPQTTQPLFMPTQALAQGSINLAPYAEPPRSFPSSSSSVSPSGNVQRLSPFHNLREHRWTHAEDLALLASIKQHGENWKLASIAVSKEGRPLRTPAATYRRYERLKKNAAKAASKPTSATLGAAAVSPTLSNASQHQHRHRPQPARPSSSSAADGPTGNLLERWSREEDETLIALRQSCEQVKDVYAGFVAAYPGTKRTANAVRTRWTQTLRARQVVENEEGNGKAATGAASASSSQISRATAASPQPRDTSQAATTPFLSATEGSGAGSCGTSPSATSAATPPLKYSIESLPQGGFAIWHLPPHYEVHILSQTVCQVVRPEAASPVPFIKIEGQDEERPMLAPFVFRMSAEGFIQPLSLPAGTETDISFLEDGDEEEEEEEGDGSGQAGIVETQFTALDNYVIVFRNRVSG